MFKKKEIKKLNIENKAKMHNKVKTNNKGFTLTEMLVVVAIIGVLAAVMGTTISNTIERAREATDLAIIRGACSEMQMVSLDATYDKNKFSKYTADNGYTYLRTYVNCVSTKDNWQTKNLPKSGSGIIICGAVMYAPSTEKPVMRILLNLDTGAFEFNREKASDARSSVYNK